jgi:hypothetical protein
MAVLPAIPLILEGIKDALIVLGVVTAGAVAADQVKKAQTRAQDLRDAAPATTCRTCGPNPCAALAGGAPGAHYKGGAHGVMKGPVGDGLDSHHMPSADASPLPRDMGPAIKMDPADHRRTASFGSSASAVAYRATQRRLIQSGRFSQAFAMDVADVRSEFGNKYDGAIAQAGAYLACLKQHRIVN